MKLSILSLRCPNRKKILNCHIGIFGAAVVKHSAKPQNIEDVADIMTSSPFANCTSRNVKGQALIRIPVPEQWRHSVLVFTRYATRYRGDIKNLLLKVSYHIEVVPTNDLQVQ